MRVAVAAFLLASVAHGAIGKPTRTLSASAPLRDPRSSWLLGAFLNLAERKPDRLLVIGEKLFHPDRLAESRKNVKLAHEWQHRLAMVSALSELFAPDRKKSVPGTLQAQARALLERALLDDPALLVRDGAAESIRRVLHMNPKLGKSWMAPLESAFLSPKNVVEGEGLFIRETILHTLREASLPLRPTVKRAALRDASLDVRDLVKLWDTASFDSLR